MKNKERKEWKEKKDKIERKGMEQKKKEKKERNENYFMMFGTHPLHSFCIMEDWHNSNRVTSPDDGKKNKN